jgi:hypothetical protein
MGEFSMTTVRRIFKVNGKPFFPLGGQSTNSSGYNEKESERAFEVIKLMHGNTLEIPVYWDIVEPEEGKFDFTMVDKLLASARRFDVKLILLWFATWKNGNMDYSPAWVKTNPQRFKRVISQTGKDIWNLSSHCKENMEADKKAFVASCKHLKAKDSIDQTVIGIQIQNEPGIMGSDRDYGPEAQAIFEAPVPTELITAMQKSGKGRVYDIWQKAGGKKSGNWADLFGWEGGELMSAWSIATYIDTMAAAGKEVLNLPMFVNVWMMEQPWWPIPGEAYPSGGAVTKVLDIYKWAAPHIDIVAPDNYPDDSRGYERNAISYSREDNPYFTPESAGDLNMFRGIAQYNLIGNFFFGVNYIADENCMVRPEYEALIENFRCVSSAIPLLLKYQGTGKVHAIIQEYKQNAQFMDFDGWWGVAEWGEKTIRPQGSDWRHASGYVWKPSPEMKFGRGLVIQASLNEFYLVGSRCRLFLRRKPEGNKMYADQLVTESMIKVYGYIVSADEGHFDKNGEFVADRRRNGDEIFRRGLWVESDIGVLRVITCD